MGGRAFSLPLLMACKPWTLALVGPSLLALAAGCTAPPAVRIAYSDFDALVGWVAMPPSLTSERAHSGRYCLKVDGGSEYSISYSVPLADTGLRPGQRLGVRGWALRTGSQRAAAVVVQVIDPARPAESVFWQAIPISKQVITYDRWVPIKETFTLPASLPGGCQLKVYLWRGSDTQPTYFDDLELLRD